MSVSVGAEAGMVHPVSMLQGGFFLPLPVCKKLPDLGGPIVRGGDKVLSVGAEAGMVHPESMLHGGFFLPLPLNKPPDLGGPIVRGGDKVLSVGAEAGMVHPVSMLHGGFFLPLLLNFFLPLPLNKLPDLGGPIVRGGDKVTLRRG